jgi:maleamate amidohydrolase
MQETKEQIYARMQIGAKVGFGKRPAIVVIDLQKGYTLRESPRWGGTGLEQVIRNTKMLVHTAKSRRVPIIYAVIMFQKNLLDSGVFGEKTPGVRMMVEGSRWVELDDAFQVSDEDVVLVKKRPSAFFGTNLLQILTYMRVDTVIVTGCNTSGCIRATVTDACCHGYRTIVPEECVGDRAGEQHVSNLFDINAKYADVMPLDSVLTYIKNLE